MTCRIICAIALALGVDGARAAGAFPADVVPGGNEEVVVIEVPLDHGRFQARDLLEALCREAGIEPGERLSGLERTIDVDSALGRLQLRVFERLVPNAVSTKTTPDRLIVQIDRRPLEAQGERLTAMIEGWALDALGWGSSRQRFGVTVVTSDDPRAPLEALPPPARRAVVLVHGLDDPGWMWRDLIPPLLESGHVVLRFEYPNDQPISDSADFLAIHLERLRAIGIEQVDIVAHSMGGLVSRDVLTRKAYYHGDGAGGERYPAIDRLIMLGTPNHGSRMARLRDLAEVREQVSRWFSGDASWRDAVYDGAGEAARDLLPESDYLRRLNARPHPAHTVYTVVAGRLSPVSEDEIESQARRIQEMARSRDGQPGRTGATSSLLKRMVRRIGDGVVSIDSARLQGVDDTVIVKGNHLSLIVNVFASDRTPPAIPIVLDRLAGSDD
ncbi:MAG: esterase/lipase family protein [Planctomycetota bacterium]|jgi:pimeloyl-ACP methyl ester carboxylesterase